MLWIIIRKAALVAVFNVLAVLIAAFIAATFDISPQEALNYFVVVLATLTTIEFISNARKVS